MFKNKSIYKSFLASLRFNLRKVTPSPTQIYTIIYYNIYYILFFEPSILYVKLYYNFTQ